MKDMKECRVKDCTKVALPGKVYCIKHIQGQRQERPIRPSSSYGTVKQGGKKRKNAE